MNWRKRSMDRIRARVNGIITRAVVATVNDALKTQRLQLTVRDEDDVADDIEHFQPYGLSFSPPADAEALLLAVGTSSDHRVAICAQHPEKRPKNVTQGTGGLYTEGVYRLYIDANGVAHIGPDALTRVAEAFIARADLTDARIEALRAKINSHTHPVSTTGTAAAQTGTASATASPLAAQDRVAASTGKVT
jgi:phage gp45-like